jgi:chromosome segregation ATPase
MGRQPTVMKEEVFTVCNELDASRQSPSVRAIQSKLGGSTSIIAEHLREWRKTKKDAPFIAELPSSIAKAITEHVNQVSGERIGQLKADLESREMDIIELGESIKKLEDELATVKDDRFLSSRRAESSETENKVLREQIKALESKVASLQKEVLEAEKKASHAEGMLRGLEKKQSESKQ